MDPLQRLQLDVAAYLESEASPKLAAIHYVPVFVTNPRDEGEEMSITDQINQALAGLTEKNGKSGLAVIVLDPEAGVPMEHIAGPFIEIDQIVRVVENKLINMSAGGTQVPAAQVAIDVLSALHGWNPGRMAIPLRGRDRRCIERIRADDDNLLVWEVLVFTRHQLRVTEATDAPIISTNGGLPAITATLTVPADSAGAAIYCSIDGSYPSTLYSAPFVVEAACTIRAIAILSGYLPSAITERDISPAIADTGGVPMADTAGGGIEDTSE